VLSAIPHGLLVVVSATFSAVFFRQLGTTASESAVYLALAVGLELAKVYFLWQRAANRARRVFSVAMVVVLALFSVLASVSFSVGSLAEDGVRHTQVREEADAYTTLIDQTKAEIELLQAKLADLPKEWRVTKNEYVEQLATLRAEQRELLAARAEARSAGAQIMDERAGFWLSASHATGIDQNRLLLAMMTVLAIILELAIAGTRPVDSTTTAWQAPDDGGRGTRSDAQVTLHDYVSVTLHAHSGDRPLSLREAAEELGITVYRARQFHELLKSLGIVATRGTRTYQTVSRGEAWQRITVGSSLLAA
jgi:hypothetical protein